MSQQYALRKGTVLHQRYEIYEIIGSGGFGITYRAFDFLLNRFVAVKEFYIEKWMERGQNGRVCQKSTLEPQEQEQVEKCRLNFLREARIMAELKNISYLSRILEAFSENDTEYIVMKLLRGESLMEYVTHGGKLTAAEVVSMIEPVLMAMEQMHEKGLLHRDICPNNLMRTGEGDLFLIDFGAATSCDPDSALWNDQVFVHRAFEAPEHLAFAQQGPWTDLYSMCASIVWLLTGEGIPDAKEREKSDGIPSLLMRSGLSAKQQNVLLKGLALDPQKRYADARGLREALCGEPRLSPEEWKVSYVAFTDIGTRQINQDNLTVDGQFCYVGSDFERDGQFACGYDELHLIAVCDGVGGACSGELASRAAVQALTHFVEQYRHSTRLPERLLDELLDQMNEKVLGLGTKIGTVATTLSLLLWKGDQYWSVNIGDSPIYLLRNRKVSRLSTPHTRAYIRMLEGKPVRPSDLHTLMNYLGKEKVAGSQIATIRHGHLQKGDLFCICSDGVTDVIDEDRLRSCFLKGEKEGIRSVRKMLKRREKRDNCSAVVIRFDEAK